MESPCWAAHSMHAWYHAASVRVSCEQPGKAPETKYNLKIASSVCWGIWLFSDLLKENSLLVIEEFSKAPNTPSLFLKNRKVFSYLLTLML